MCSFDLPLKKINVAKCVVSLLKRHLSWICLAVHAASNISDRGCHTARLWASPVVMASYPYQVGRNN